MFFFSHFRLQPDRILGDVLFIEGRLHLRTFCPLRSIEGKLLSLIPWQHIGPWGEHVKHVP